MNTQASAGRLDFHAPHAQRWDNSRSRKVTALAQQIHTVLVDDITGKEIPVGEGETVHFTYNGTNYQIDLDPKNAAKYHQVMDIYVRHAQKLGRAGSVTTMRRGKKNDEVDNQAVRAWAESNGIEISARGRISATVIEQYREAMA
jgi:nucleoid-associated protein Lsr2